MRILGARDQLEPVAWDVARKVATRALSLVAPVSTAPSPDLEASLLNAAKRAEQLAEFATGLRSPEHLHSVVVDRAGWVEANINSFQRLLQPLVKKLADNPARARRIMNPASRNAAGVEVGLLLAWMSGRVLGQYDLAPSTDDRSSGAVYFVAPNIVSIERRHGFDPEQFRLWIAIHEVTHRQQFTAVPWMKEYFLSLIERGASLATPETNAIVAWLRDAVTALREGRNPLPEGGLIGIVATGEQMATLQEAQALMSLLEGHADSVMTRAAPSHIPDAQHFASVIADRRASASGMTRIIQRLLGVEAKLRQYSEGEKFVAAILAAGGDELFNSIWESPERLPNLEEIRDPKLWLARVRDSSLSRQPS